MSLAHALLVSLAEKSGTGLQLTRRFDKSLGFFWRATHQQIYRTLKTLKAHEWVTMSPVASEAGGAPAKEYKISGVGADALREWLGQSTPLEQPKSELALKLRALGFANADDLHSQFTEALAGHLQRAQHFSDELTKHFPQGEPTDPHRLGIYLVLRGGVALEDGYQRWCREVLAALSSQRSKLVFEGDDE